jgi:hypothetical protein
MKTAFPLVCQNCQKTFYVYNSYYVNTRPIRFCSSYCSQRRGKLNIDYFDTLTKETLHTLGQVIACGFISNVRTISITSDLVTLEKIQSKLESNYAPRKSDLGKFMIEIHSDKIVNILQSYGLVTNQYFQEYPSYDILSGLLDTDCYKEVDGVRTFRHHSHKLILEMQYQLGGEIITETYKDVFRGILGCWWVLIW